MREPNCPECGASGKRLHSTYGTVTFNGSGIVSGRFTCRDCKTAFGWHYVHGHVRFITSRERENEVSTTQFTGKSYELRIINYENR